MARRIGEGMFSGVIESQSHEGGFLVSFSGSSPALESIIINADSGDYIGKVDAVLGNSNAPLAHVAHIDRKLDLSSLIGIEVGIRAKKQREERGRDRNGGGRDSRDRRSGGFERNDRRNDNRNGGGDWDCPKCNNSNFAFRQECNRCGEPRGRGGGGHSHRNDRRDNRRDDRQGGRFDRNDRRNDNRNGGGDWDCPKCNNSNFAFRQECNRCGEPRGRGGGNRGGYNQRDSGRRNEGRYDRDSRRGSDNRRRSGEIFNDNDWECPQCNNSNFAFRQECNRCQAPRPGGRGGGGRGNDSGGRPPRRDDRGRSSYGGGRGNDSGGRPPRRDDRGRSSYGGGRGNDSGGRPPRRDDRGRSSYGGGRGNDSGDRPPRRDDAGGRPVVHNEGGRPPRRDGRSRQTEGGFQRSNDSRDGFDQRRNDRDERPTERKSREPREFRKSRGKGPGHAHNRPPKPLGHRDRED
ncbi:MAG: hypothetical protein CMA63_07190 [Euryarchaeota archaeon]|nr:hypothetical protein [Euryarchaeota archaeon]